MNQYDKISDLQIPGDEKTVCGTVQLKEGMTKEEISKAYLTLKITDGSGSCSITTFSNNAKQYNSLKYIPSGAFVEATLVYNGDLNGFKDIGIKNLKVIPNPLSGYLSNREQLYNELINIVNSITELPLQEICVKTINDNAQALLDAPASLETGYSYSGGALTHIVRVMQACDAISLLYNTNDYSSDGIKVSISRDALVTGALLSEIGCCLYYSINVNGKTCKTDLGRISSLEMVLSKTAEHYISSSNLDEKKKMLLRHITESAYSSIYKTSVSARTTEAKVLADIKSLDKSIATMELAKRIPLSDEIFVKVKDKEFCKCEWAD